MVRFARVAAIIVATILAPMEARANYLTSLYFSPNIFEAGPGGQQDQTGLTFGTDGNLYGTTFTGGGVNHLGTVFQLTPTGSFAVLHSFGVNDPSGAGPENGLVPAANGSFYGVTTSGLFNITSGGAFTSIGAGSNSPESVVVGNDGNFYGTAYVGGVYQLTPGGVYTLLHTLAFAEGGTPNPLIQATDGNFYGTAYSGGSSTCDGGSGCGTIFRITKTGVLTVLHTFNNSDGNDPSAALVQGSDGNLYGTTTSGGSSNSGTIFKISLSGGTFTSLHSFSGTDGVSPQSALIQGSDGNFYGTTIGGGGATAQGTAFKITPAGSFTNLFAFPSLSTSIYPTGPAGNIVLSSNGSTLYGLTHKAAGPAGAGGVAYALTIGSGTGADLSFSASSGSENSSGASTYSLTISNSGSQAATGVTLQSQFPANTTFASSTGTSCQTVSGVLTCTVGTIAPGASVLVGITLQTTPVAIISPSFVVSSNVSDPNIANNTTTVSVSPPVADLSLNWNSATVSPSGVAPFNLTVNNAGPGNAPGVTLTTTVPVGTTLVSSSTNLSCSQSNQQITCTFGTLNDGASAPVVVTLQTNTPSQPLAITFTVNSADSDPSPANNILSVADAPPGYNVPTLPPWSALVFGISLIGISVRANAKDRLNLDTDIK